ncbi:MAG: hypothetical protein KDC84_03835 [Crocinitomicaceae bacterium]|nr:hypothetical protein [Crocinitomicaceae bacterium]
MVKKLLLLVLLTTTFSFGQRFELGIGAKGNFNWMKSNDDFTSGIVDVYDDTLFMKFDQVKMNMSYSIPVFVRFRTNFGFWTELSFSTEKLTTKGYGTANYSDYTLNGWVMYNLTQDYPNSGYNDPNQFRLDYYDQYFNREKEYWEEQVAYEEVTQYNNVALNFGYTFLRTKKFRPFALLGVEWNSRTNKNHYQSLIYSSYWIEDYSPLYRKLPRLNSHLFFINIGAGIELYNMQLGLNLRQSVGYTQEYEFKDEVDKTSNPYSELYKNITGISFFLKYSLFNFNIRNADDRKKLKEEELKVLGDFKEKSKIIKLSVGAHVPIYTNVNSLYDKRYPKDTVLIMENGAAFTENVYLYNQRVESGVGPTGGFVTDTAYTLVGLGRIKRISIFPKLSFGVEVEPVKYFSYEASLNYQFSEYDTEAKVLKYDINWVNNTSSYLQRTTVMRQTLHTISIGQKLNVKYDVTPELFIGVNGGVNLNFIAPGKHKSDYPGYNADPIFEEFDNFIFRGDSTRNWNFDYGGGDPNNIYQYVYLNEQTGYFEGVPTDEVMTIDKGRFWMTWTAGIDIYFDRLRISPYIEGAIIDQNFLYQDYLSGGIGFTFYLRK